MTNLDPLAEAFLRCAEYGGGEPFVVDVDLDHSTAILGETSLFHGLTVAQWAQN